jgi:hypothetical protein
MIRVNSPTTRAPAQRLANSMLAPPVHFSLSQSYLQKKICAFEIRYRIRMLHFYSIVVHEAVGREDSGADRKKFFRQDKMRKVVQLRNS